MKRFGIFVAVACFTAGAVQAETNKICPVSVPGIVNIQATDREAPPSWAVRQRHLIQMMEEAAPLYLEKYTYRGGTMKRNAKLDDDYECFDKWALLYVIGGDEKLLNWSIDEWNAITRQWENRTNLREWDPVKRVWKTNPGTGVYKEFVDHNDGLHLSEGYNGFQYFGLADPAIPENIDRSKRFAGFYLGEEPGVFNYDPKYKVIRSTSTGSKGPLDKQNGAYAISYGHVSLYPFVKEVEWDWNKNPKREKQLLDLYDKIATPCDYPMNLAITGLITNAYIYTGDEKYKKWVLEYTDAWMDRIRENNGIVPDNVGRTGKVGEYRKGQWWGGVMGWSSRYSIHAVTVGMVTAMQCAHLLTGDDKYEDLIRSQVDALLKLSKTDKGQLLVPHMYGPEGWHDYRPMPLHLLAYLWHESLDPQDWQRAKRVFDGMKYNELKKPDIGDARPKPGTEGWEADYSSQYDIKAILREELTRNGDETAHVLYLNGDNPGWPDSILSAEYDNVLERVARINDPSWESSWKSQTVLQETPVLINGLVQMTMGAPAPNFNGGLLRAQVRYFDMDRVRPGLPPDVAALVEKVAKDHVVVTLVNTNGLETRNAILQAGAFGEHTFTDVAFKESMKNQAGKTEVSEKKVPVNRSYVAVTLPPGTAITLDMGMTRFVNKPSYVFPWHGGKLPTK